MSVDVGLGARLRCSCSTLRLMRLVVDEAFRLEMPLTVWKRSRSRTRACALVELAQRRQRALGDEVSARLLVQPSEWKGEVEVQRRLQESSACRTV